jgi:UDP-N-acetylglucosamine:LPS N-acetylglucosamine transferase
MGDGHLRVAAELRRRLLARGHDAESVDLLPRLPLGLGAVLRTGYAAMLAHAPALYEAIYRGFFLSEGHSVNFRADPLVAASAPAVRRLVAQYRPDTVVSTFHLCGQIAGRLRAAGHLDAVSIVYVTDFVAHRMWLHPGNDLFVCPHPSVAAQASAGSGRPAVAAAPAVGEAFRALPDGAAVRARVRRGLGVPASASVVLVSAGAWGSGAVLDAVDAVASRRHVTVVLCGRNRNLYEALASGRARVSADGAQVMALPWREDVADVMRASDLLVENAAGQTAMEALAVGLPVVTFRPLPGHGRDGARRMRELGLSGLAGDRRELARLTAELLDPGSTRRAAQIAAGRAMFTADPVELLDSVVAVT